MSGIVGNGFMGRGGAPAAQPFIFTVTVGSGQSFQLPTVSTGIYDAIIDWGDTTSNALTVWNVDRTHTYTTGGTYEIKISGVFDGWSVGGYADRLNITEIKQWGILKPGNGFQFMKNAANMIISATDVLDTSACISMSEAFNGTTALNDIPSINSWDFSNVTNMLQMFRLSNFNTYIGDIDVSSVGNMQGMFQLNPSYSHPFTNWVTTSLTNLRDFIFAANAFNHPIPFNTASVSDMQGAFRSSIFNQDLTNLSFVSATTCFQMLRGTSMSTANWSNLLISINNQAVQNNVPIECTAKHNSSAVAARAALIADHNWSITDLGLE